jgi:hypothetical protein
MIVGIPTQKELVVSGWYDGIRRCTHPEIEDGLFFLSPHALCVDSAFPDVFPGSRIMVSGLSSPLGQNVEDVYVSESMSSNAKSP